MPMIKTFKNRSSEVRLNLVVPEFCINLVSLPEKTKTMEPVVSWWVTMSLNLQTPPFQYSTWCFSRCNLATEAYRCQVGNFYRPNLIAHRSY